MELEGLLRRGKLNVGHLDRNRGKRLSLLFHSSNAIDLGLSHSQRDTVVLAACALAARMLLCLLLHSSSAVEFAFSACISIAVVLATNASSNAVVLAISKLFHRDS